MRERRNFRPIPQAAQGGFSLIEIIVVVVLIGGIVAFAASRILGGGDRAKVKLAQAQLQTLAEKVQQFQMDTGALPPSLDALVASRQSVTIPLARPVPVYIAYFTAGTRADGSLAFYADIYGRDKHVTALALAGGSECSG